MTNHPDRCEALARLLEYPDDSFATRLECARDRLRPDDSLSAFTAGTEALPLHALEELYIQTFDFNPKCTLDLGWQLFAEDYNRGLFLAKLRTLSQQLGVPETAELPDHLPHVLRLLARMTPAEAQDFAATCGAPAVEKTLNAIDESNPYRHLVHCALAQLQELAGAPTVVNMT